MLKALVTDSSLYSWWMVCETWDPVQLKFRVHVLPLSSQGHPWPEQSEAALLLVLTEWVRQKFATQVKDCSAFPFFGFMPWWWMCDRSGKWETSTNVFQSQHLYGVSESREQTAWFKLSEANTEMRRLMILSSPDVVCFQERLDPETCGPLGSRFFCGDSFGSVPSVYQIRHSAGSFHGSCSDKRFLSPSPHHTNQRKRESLVAAQEDETLPSCLTGTTYCYQGTCCNYLQYSSWHKITTLEANGRLFQIYVYILFGHTKYLCTQWENCYSRRITFCLQFCLQNTDDIICISFLSDACLFYFKILITDPFRKYLIYYYW